MKYNIFVLYMLNVVLECEYFGIWIMLYQLFPFYGRFSKLLAMLDFMLVLLWL